MTTHPCVRIWLHLIWTTHNLKKELTGNLTDALREHLLAHSEKIDVPILSINIQPEHVHCLISLPAKMSISNVIQALKGESSRWINEKGLTEHRFQWNRGFGAFSISSAHVDRLKKEIIDQDDFHKDHTFAQEYKWWAMKYGVWRKI
ncbi:MAG: IS200/IS605 family transposase [Candidatus Eremiobacteraeota bacterium]|nr:IS200/IS605 family transposase [Candidatus Eremiobacteraeota bacterium]